MIQIIKEILSISLLLSRLWKKQFLLCHDDDDRDDDYDDDEDDRDDDRDDDGHDDDDWKTHHSSKCLVTWWSTGHRNA